ncbi:conserved hypothetical protein [Burkholderiales bacterium 8X]|nr:conserved hypothetical protein [Burkholderiales bacterium 8X]
MKLLGSRTENQIRDDLIRSNIALRDNIDGPLSEALQSSGIPVVDALVVNWVHEQAEDIYFVLLSDIELLLVQVSRLKLPVKIDRIGVESYGRNLTKVQRLKLTVALDL